MFDKKKKAVTFSYDDGVTQDIRLIELFNKYGLKATFNLNSGLLGQSGSLLREEQTVSHNKNRPEDVRTIYAGHEVASHTLTHPLLTGLPEEEIVRQVEEDRKKLSELCGYEVVGFAYPCGGVNYDSRVSRILAEKTGVQYARTIVSSHAFGRQDNLLECKPTVYHHREFDLMFELAERFLAAESEEPQVLYIWGHAYEFDIFDQWERMEEFCRLIAGHDDVFYGTNREVLLAE
ncbi:MAG: polysaccharide deacetylase family protein [Ruminococcus sp.]|nr:polysaccharide deacetylase family protein [Candidatus Apopatosoma intestinale]